MKGIFMKKTTPMIFGLLFLLMLSSSLAGAAWAGGLSGVVKPQGLRSAEGILVYVVKAPDPGLDLSGANFVMDQRRLTFLPHIMPIPVGAKASFPNNDEVAHNVFSLSKVKSFNLGSYSPGKSESVIFDKPGVIELRCDVHQEMSAYIIALKNPYFAVTDKNGRFTIPDPKYLKAHGIKAPPALPPGNYRVKSWHEKLKTASQKVEITGGDVKIELKPKRGAPGALYK